MIVSITEADGTKRVMQGAIHSIDINVESPISELSMHVIGITRDFTFKIKGNVHITESEVL